ncbi:hypothetical protein [Wolbachia endosymbiont of Folsomia candida]|uniref:hypothetical protein n=1 Tax=Wolbachia endosymbiont of Folsomia candida TaxID=169402 RepID=UPI000AC74DC7|nr:hypothetical protein [Wolbachia endosymbiont of Folsomia candida]APR98032.1 hypothetical protein ASM33_01790 [Wolbachia endosymbiont of Folsomia candida]
MSDCFSNCSNDHCVRIDGEGSWMDKKCLERCESFCSERYGRASDDLYSIANRIEFPGDSQYSEYLDYL